MASTQSGLNHLKSLVDQLTGIAQRGELPQQQGQGVVIDTFQVIGEIAAQLNARVSKLEGGSQKGKRASEIRSLVGLKALGSNRTEYRSWLAKFINIMSQTGSETRAVLEKIQKSVDMNEEVKYDDLDDVHEKLKRDDGTYRLTEDQVKILDEDLYFVLTDKTEGDALKSHVGHRRSRACSVCKVTQVVCRNHGPGNRREGQAGHAPGHAKERGRNPRGHGKVGRAGQAHCSARATV